MSAMGTARIVIATALLNGPCSRDVLLKITPQQHKTPLDNALYDLRAKGLIDRDPAGVWSIAPGKRSAIEALAAQRPRSDARRILEERRDAEFIRCGPDADAQPTPTERAATRLLDTLAKPPQRETADGVGGPEDSVLFGVNELGELEVSQRDGEGSVVPIPLCEIPRLLRFLDKTRHLRADLAAQAEAGRAAQPSLALEGQEEA